MNETYERCVVRLTALATLWLTSACVATPARIAVAGSGADIAAVEGFWRGEFKVGAKVGTITFDVTEDSSADGEVILVWAGLAGETPSPEEVAAWSKMHTTNFLKMESGGVEAGRIELVMTTAEGTADGASLRATFTGQMDDQTVRGDYSIVAVTSGEQVTGGWEARRVVR